MRVNKGIWICLRKQISLKVLKSQMKYHFENLEIYKISVLLTKEVYKVSKKLPKHEEFVLKSQLLRAVTSIVLNISEGSGRRTAKEKMNFISIAIGSLQEVVSIIKLLVDLQELAITDIIEIERLEEMLYFKLIGFKKSLTAL